jgi:hypothetical protein
VKVYPVHRQHGWTALAPTHPRQAWFLFRWSHMCFTDRGHALFRPTHVLPQITCWKSTLSRHFVPVKCLKQCPTVPNSAQQCPTLPNSAQQCPTVPNSAQQCPTVPNSAQQCPTVPNNFTQTLQTKRNISYVVLRVLQVKILARIPAILRLHVAFPSPYPSTWRYRTLN